MRSSDLLSCGVLVCLAAACSPTPKPEPVELHRAAVKLRVLLQEGFDPESLAHATSDLHVEYEVAKTSLPDDASKKCDRAASMSDSFRRIFHAVAVYDPDELAGLKAELQNVGLVKKEGDWQDIQYHINYSLPNSSDTSAMASEREQLRTIESRDLVDPARNAALKAARECENAS